MGLAWYRCRVQAQHGNSASIFSLKRRKACATAPICDIRPNQGVRRGEYGSADDFTPSRSLDGCFAPVGKGGIGIGGARGKGYVYQKGRLIGRSTLTQVSIGLQLGGQAYSEVVFLKNAAAMEGFKNASSSWTPRPPRSRSPPGLPPTSATGMESPL